MEIHQNRGISKNVWPVDAIKSLKYEWCLLVKIKVFFTEITYNDTHHTKNEKELNLLPFKGLQAPKLCKNIKKIGQNIHISDIFGLEYAIQPLNMHDFHQKT